MRYFKNPKSLEELRKQYRDLLKIYHPDNAAGSTEATQEINSEYEYLFKMLKNIHQTKTEQSGSTDDMKWNTEEDEMLRQMLSKVVTIQGITIEIIGNWIWLGGNTYQNRKELKELGFKFASSKKMWYWHSEAFQKKSHKKLSMNDIRNYYGSTRVALEPQILLQA